MEEKPLTISQIYARGRENLAQRGWTRRFPPQSSIGAQVEANRKYLDNLFFEPNYFDPVEADTGFNIFGTQLKTPIFCSPLSKVEDMSENDLTDIARGVAGSGAMMMLGIGGSRELQEAIDTGAPVVKIVKPYRNIELIYEKVREAESRGCAAVGMDIDHFYGSLQKGDLIMMAETFGPQRTDELRQVISQSKLPFIVKGVLGVRDAQKAVELGASAILVSNHGYSAIDFTVPSLIALPRIADAVGDKATVLVDTGFQTGNDILKAVALGARAVGFASPLLLAMGVGGAEAVALLIDKMTEELRRTMAATGCPNLSSVNRSIIVEGPPLW
ncbi:MAG: alpha-hydroxy acid oxidase [Dehalococcoidia bacterium]|jgi:isopentenyl diphosphate isomerase/L-lactate dehydrogenase-like FMN-dependent dehydrogenase|nr:alpha-hydroxy acid oxidase [Dehalococcoidia bacterium]